MDIRSINIAKSSDSNLSNMMDVIGHNHTYDTHLIVRAYGASSVSLSKIQSLHGWDEDMYDVTIVLWFPKEYYSQDYYNYDDFIKSLHDRYQIRVYTCSLYEVAGYNSIYDSEVLSILCAATFNMFMGNITDPSITFMSRLSKKQLNRCIIPIELLIAMSHANGKIMAMDWKYAHDNHVKLFSSTIKTIWSSVGEHTNRVSDYDTDFLRKKLDNVRSNIGYNIADSIIDPTYISNVYNDCAKHLSYFIDIYANIDCKFKLTTSYDLMFSSDDHSFAVADSIYSTETLTRAIDRGIIGDNHSNVGKLCRTYWSDKYRFSILEKSSLKYIYDSSDLQKIQIHHAHSSEKFNKYTCGEVDGWNNMYHAVGWNGHELSEDLSGLIMLYYDRYNMGMDDVMTMNAIMAYMGINVSKGGKYDFDTLNNRLLRDMDVDTMQLMYIYFCMCKKMTYSGFVYHLTRYIFIFSNMSKINDVLGNNSCPVDIVLSLRSGLNNDQYMEVFAGNDDFMDNVATISKYVAHIKTDGKYGIDYNELR